MYALKLRLQSSDSADEQLRAPPELTESGFYTSAARDIINEKVTDAINQVSTLAQSLIAEISAAEAAGIDAEALHQELDQLENLVGSLSRFVF